MYPLQRLFKYMISLANMVVSQASKIRHFYANAIKMDFIETPQKSICKGRKITFVSF